MPRFWFNICFGLSLFDLELIAVVILLKCGGDAAVLVGCILLVAFEVVFVVCTSLLLVCSFSVVTVYLAVLGRVIWCSCHCLGITSIWFNHVICCFTLRLRRAYFLSYLYCDCFFLQCVIETLPCRGRVWFATIATTRSFVAGMAVFKLSTPNASASFVSASLTSFFLSYVFLFHLKPNPNYFGSTYNLCIYRASLTSVSAPIALKTQPWWWDVLANGTLCPTDSHIRWEKCASQKLTHILAS